jgi:hypothetical protein
LIEAAAAEPIVVDAVPAASQEDWALVPAPAHELPVPIEAPARKPRVSLAGHRWVLALAAAVLLVVTALATGWDRPTPPGSATPPGPAAPSGPAPASATVVAAVPRTEVVEARPAATSGSAVVKKDVQRASLVKPAGQRSPRTADRPKPSRAKARPAPAPPPQRKSFFKRELFRIVIK